MQALHISSPYTRLSRGYACVQMLHQSRVRASAYAIRFFSYQGKGCEVRGSTEEQCMRADVAQVAREGYCICYSFFCILEF